MVSMKPTPSPHALRAVMVRVGALPLISRTTLSSPLTTKRALTFAVVLPALLVAHDVADHWVQTAHQARNKGLPGWVGRRACAAHAATYTTTTGLTVGALTVALGLPLTLRAFVAGQLVSALTHYWADRRVTLARLCEATGKGAFYQLGTPRQGHDDNPTLGTGAYALDQSWHRFWLLIAALITAGAS